MLGSIDSSCVVEVWPHAGGEQDSTNQGKLWASMAIGLMTTNDRYLRWGCIFLDYQTNQ